MEKSKLVKALALSTAVGMGAGNAQALPLLGDIVDGSITKNNQQLTFDFRSTNVNLSRVFIAAPTDFFFGSEVLTTEGGDNYRLNLSSLTLYDTNSNEKIGGVVKISDDVLIPDSLTTRIAFYNSGGFNYEETQVNVDRELTASKVPEPSTLLIFGIGLYGLNRIRRKEEEN